MYSDADADAPLRRARPTRRCRSAARRRPRPTCDGDADRRRRAAHRRRRGPPRLRLPRPRTPTFAGAVHRRRPDLGRPAARGDRGDGRQARGEAAHGGRRRAGAARARPAPTPTTCARGRPVGFPLLVKAAAGGGGTGHARRARRRPSSPRRSRRRAREARVARSATAPCSSSATSSAPRHVEVQILGDAHGNVVHLGERECSIQRRHQKIVEEAPSPGRRRRRCAARWATRAVAAGAAIGYVGAGTVEFLARRATGEFYFLEMNTRLQVEHPVTELVTGLDLVRAAARGRRGRAAAGAGGRRAHRGHAIEVAALRRGPGARASCPSTGHAAPLRRPAERPACASTPASRTGSVVASHYDPMLAKVIAHGADREPRRRGRLAPRARAAAHPRRRRRTATCSSRVLRAPRVPRRRHRHRLPRAPPTRRRSARRCCDEPSAARRTPGRRARAAGASAAPRRRCSATLPRGWRNVRLPEPQCQALDGAATRIAVRVPARRATASLRASVDGEPVAASACIAATRRRRRRSRSTGVRSSASASHATGERVSSTARSARSTFTRAAALRRRRGRAAPRARSSRRCPGVVRRGARARGDDVARARCSRARGDEDGAPDLARRRGGSVAEVLRRTPASSVESGRRARVVDRARDGRISATREMRRADPHRELLRLLRRPARRRARDGRRRPDRRADRRLARRADDADPRAKTRPKRRRAAATRRTFVTQMEQVLGHVPRPRHQGRRRTPADSTRPAAPRRSRELAAEARPVAATIAHVEGDDLLPRLDELQARRDRSRTSTPASRSRQHVAPVIAPTPTSAAGASPRRSTRAPTSSSPARHRRRARRRPGGVAFGWARDDWDALAGAVVAGHVIECGAQATGGNYSFFREVPGLRAARLPDRRDARGRLVVITKHPGTGGAGLGRHGDVAAALRDRRPAYLEPRRRPRASTRSSSRRTASPTGCACRGVRGEPPPPTTQGLHQLLGGFRNAMTFVLDRARHRGEGARSSSAASVAPASAAASASPRSHVRLRAPTRPTRRRTRSAIAHAHDRGEGSPTSRRSGARSRTRVVEMALASYPGFYTTQPARASQSPIGVYWPALVPADAVDHRGGASDGDAVAIPRGRSRKRRVRRAGRGARRRSPAPPGGADRARAPLGRGLRRALRRQGRQRQRRRLGRTTDAAYAWLAGFLTVGQLRELLPETAPLEVERLRAAEPAARSTSSSRACSARASPPRSAPTRRRRASANGCARATPTSPRRSSAGRRGRSSDRPRSGYAWCERISGAKIAAGWR